MTTQDLIYELEGNPFNDILRWMLVESLTEDKGMVRSEAEAHVRHLQEVAVKSSELFTASAVLRTTGKDRDETVAQVCRCAGAPSAQVPVIVLDGTADPFYHRAVPPAPLTTFGLAEVVTVGASVFLGIYEHVVTTRRMERRARRTRRVNNHLAETGQG